MVKFPSVGNLECKGRKMRTRSSRKSEQCVILFLDSYLKGSSPNFLAAIQVISCRYFRGASRRAGQLNHNWLDGPRAELSVPAARSSFAFEAATKSASSRQSRVRVGTFIY